MIIYMRECKVVMLIVYMSRDKGDEDKMARVKLKIGVQERSKRR